ncbi:unnamed protein product [Orchesella dallaii]|uniref:Uncharacterized protein n=1 Tax=Orchesella dallaii TaxID=48710 RepID=A0ABP1PXS2_9HEXA
MYQCPDYDGHQFEEVKFEFKVPDTLDMDEETRQLTKEMEEDDRRRKKEEKADAKKAKKEGKKNGKGKKGKASADAKEDKQEEEDDTHGVTTTDTEGKAKPTNSKHKKDKGGVGNDVYMA